ncbi:ras-domain-containing protein [Rhodotorula sp. JG-1b]|nr:ras-domain-containing protein [Rhodotorula sp. JG-1b]
MASWDFIQKQILLGDAACGKSSLLVRLTDDRFLQHSEPTIGVEFGSRIVEIKEGDDAGKRIKLQIWDTAGQESFRAITRSYYRGAGGALLVFSLTSHQSFTNCRGWLADLRQWGEEDLLVLLVGNKGDVLSTTEEGGGGGGAERREVEREEAERWAEEEGLAGYVETSAKSGAGVEEAFNTLTRLVHAKQQATLASNRAANKSNSRRSGIVGGLPNISLTGGGGGGGGGGTGSRAGCC